MMAAAPLRVAVCGAAADDAALWAAVLVRTGLDIQIDTPATAEVAVAEDPAPPALSIPAVTIPRWRPADAAEWRRGLATGGLLGVVGGWLAGWAETGAPRDEHVRPTPESNPRHARGGLATPAVDVACRALGRRLWEAARPGVPLPAAPWCFCPTLDIDSPGMVTRRALPGVVRRVALGAPRRLPALAGVVARTALRLLPDPHVALRQIGELLEGLDAPATFFCQARILHRWDDYALRPGDPIARGLRDVLRNGFHAVGLHSSYATPDRPATFAGQWDRLARVLGADRIAPLHRAHYLRFDAARPPAREGGYIDSSVGYGRIEGFRRATAWPYALAPGIVEAPPTIMDSTLIHFRRDTPETATTRALTMMATVAANGGLYIPIWHPHNMEPIEHPGWAEVLVDLVREAKSRGARLLPLAHAVAALDDRRRLLQEQIGKAAAA